MDQDTLVQKIEQLSADLALLHRAVHGTETETVLLGGVATPSYRKLVADVDARESAAAQKAIDAGVVAMGSSATDAALSAAAAAQSAQIASAGADVVTAHAQSIELVAANIEAVQDASGNAVDAAASAAAAAASAAAAAGASGGLAPRMDAVESKNIQQDTRLDAVEGKNTQQDTRLDAVDASLIDKLKTDMSNLAASGINVLFPALKGASGYQKFANGLIIQWGSVAANNTYAFPVEFPNVAVAIAWGRVDGGNGTPGADNINKTNFVYRSLNVANTPARYIAIGY